MFFYWKKDVYVHEFFLFLDEKIIRNLNPILPLLELVK
jgi:hypothetical protein